MCCRPWYDLVRVEKGEKRAFYTADPEFHRATSPNGDWALYHRKLDPAQEINLAGEKPVLVREMREEFERWWDDSEAFLIHER